MTNKEFFEQPLKLQGGVVMESLSVWFNSYGDYWDAGFAPPLKYLKTLKPGTYFFGDRNNPFFKWPIVVKVETKNARQDRNKRMVQ